MSRWVHTHHPKARRLLQLADAQGTVRGRTPHVIWLDDDAGVLLHLQRHRAKAGRPAEEDRLVLRRMPLHSAACQRALGVLSQWSLKRLDDPGAYPGRRGVWLSLQALEELFTIQLARLRLDGRSPADIDSAIAAYVGQAHTPQEAERRAAFRDWHVQSLCGDPFTKVKPARAAQALGTDVARLPEGLAGTLGAWRAYQAKIAKRHAGQRPARERRPTRREHLLRTYVELRTEGRQLDEDQMAKITRVVGDCRLRQDLLIVDELRGSGDNLPWRPEKVFAGYFDAGLYFHQSGARYLWLRLPRSLAEEALPYQVPGALSLTISRDVLLVEFSRYEEDSDYADSNPKPWLRKLLPLRESLAAGDLRALYIGWQAANSERGAGSKLPQVSVPPEMHALTPPLRALRRFLTHVP